MILEQTKDVKEVNNGGKLWDLSPGRIDFKGLPFPRFFVKDFIRPDIFSELVSQYPSMDYFHLLKGNKYNLRLSDPSCADFFKKSPLWRAFIGSLQTQEFVEAVQNVLYRGLKKDVLTMISKPRWVSRQFLPRLRPWRYADGRRYISPLEHPVQVTIAFSKINEGLRIEPHNDSSGKIASLLLYMPPADWKGFAGGETVFYIPKDKNFKYVFGDPNRYSFEEMTPIDQSVYGPNRVCCLFKTVNSFHGVAPMTLPPGVFRDSINIFITDASVVFSAQDDYGQEKTNAGV